MAVIHRTRRSLLAGSALAGLAVLAVPAHGQDGASATTEKKGRVTLLDRITISPTRIDEAVIDALAAESMVDEEELDRIQADNVSEVFRSVPGVAASPNGDDAATAINIRGLQQSGRVVVTLDGARQDFWRVGHGSGSFFVEPDLLKEVTVIRGPVSNTFGTGGIGGVVAFETMDAGDFLHDDETWALSQKLGYETNGDGTLTSTVGAYRFNEDADVIANITYRDSNDYENGDGVLVPWTGDTVAAGYVKGTFRPADGHELELAAILQDYDDVITGSSGSPTASRWDARTVNQTYTGTYTYNPDDSDMVDFFLNVYHNNTRADQDKFYPAADDKRYYDVATTGFNTYNSSTFNAHGMEQTLTYGADFHHIVGESDYSHFGAGTQDAWGGFLQWKGNRSDWLELIAAIRYDGYQVDGQTRADPPEDASLDGNRWSPRFTVGVTPVEGLQFYGGYSEGYRAPTVQEVFRGGGAHGSSDTYVPNLLLQPEVAKSWEAGVNVKYNDLLALDDSLRAKINLFHTDVDDYIEVDLLSLPRMAKNIGDARLQGVEIESVYDFNWGFVNVSGAWINAEIVSGQYAGQPLNNTPLDRFSATLGFRGAEGRLVYGLQYLSVGEITRTSRSNPSAETVVDPSFELVNLFADWQVNDSLKFTAGIDNIFNEVYTDPQTAWSTSVLAPEQGKGRTLKISMTGRIGG